MKFIQLILISLLLIALPTIVQAQKQTDNFLEQHKIKSIAILPPVGESVPSSVRVSAGALFVSEAQRQLKELKITLPEETTTALEKTNRLDDFTSFLNLFIKTGTVNKSPLARIGESLATDAILLIDVQDFEAQNGSWMRARNGHNSARVQYTLFSPAGEQLWQHLVVYTHTPQFTAKADKAEKVMQDVSRRAVSALMRGIQNSDPKKDVEVP